jgi:glycosyltransferase involved in cell wall biosynthesis
MAEVVSTDVSNHVPGSEFSWEDNPPKIDIDKKLLILDDIFPLLTSGFRLAEYNAYLAHFARAEVYSTGASLHIVGEPRSFSDIKEEYAKRYPQLAARVHKIDADADFDGDFAYTIFVNNMRRNVRRLDEKRIPFAFTLYPGGGFGLNRPESDAKLARITASRYFRKVIVTQRIVRDYLLEKGFCSPSHIELIYGVICQSIQAERRYYQIHKESLDICFAAHRYVDVGRGKGYDIFIDVAHGLASQNPRARFHVVGGFTPDDVDVSALGSRISFYGAREPAFFGPFFRNMDLIVAPNRPFVTTPIHFDGFPTGCCAEAGLAGVPVFAADPLGLNIAFRDGEDIVLISHDRDEIIARIVQHTEDPERLVALSRRTAMAFRRVFGPDAQVAPRLRILSDLMAAA